MPNGRILVAGNLTSVDSQTAYSVVRLLSDGRIDADFAPIAAPPPLASGADILADVLMEPDGGFLVSTTRWFDPRFRDQEPFYVTRTVVQQYLADGRPQGEPWSYGAEVKLRHWVGGGLAAVGNLRWIMGTGGFTAPYLNMAGTLWQIYFEQYDEVSDFLVGRNGNLILARRNTRSLLALDSTGWEAWNYRPSIYGQDAEWIREDSKGRLVCARSYSSRPFRLHPNGTIDRSYALPVLYPVSAVHLDDRDRLIVAGGFSNVVEFARSGLVAFLEDGTVDVAFDPGAGFSEEDRRPPSSVVTALADAAGGGLLVAGPFQSFDGHRVRQLIRLHAQNPNASGPAPPVFYLEPQSTGPQECGAVASIDVVRAGDATSTNWVWISTKSLTATPGVDYVPVQEHLAFRPGERRRTLEIKALPDGVPDPDESFEVELSEPDTGAVLGLRFRSIQTIMDFPCAAEFTTNRVVVSEGAGSVVIALNGNPAPVLRVRSLDRSALVGRDFDWIDQPLTSNWIQVGIRDDRLNQGDREFELEMYATVSGASVGPQSRVVVTILDDDNLAGPRRGPGGGSGNLNGVVPMPDGRWYVFGGFVSYDGQPRNHIARLLADGTVDESFVPSTEASTYSIRSGIALPGNQLVLLLGGGPPGGLGFRLVRLHADGRTDLEFRPLLWFSIFGAGTLGADGNDVLVALDPDRWARVAPTGESRTFTLPASSGPIRAFVPTTSSVVVVADNAWRFDRSTGSAQALFGENSRLSYSTTIELMDGSFVRAAWDRRVALYLRRLDANGRILPIAGAVVSDFRVLPRLMSPPEIERFGDQLILSGDFRSQESDPGHMSRWTLDPPNFNPTTPFVPPAWAAYGMRPIPGPRGYILLRGMIVHLDGRLNPIRDLRFERVLAGPDGTLHARLAGQTFGDYVVERSSDLRSWNRIETNSLPESGWLFRDPAVPTSPAAFYRLVY